MTYRSFGLLLIGGLALGSSISINAFAFNTEYHNEMTTTALNSAGVSDNNVIQELLNDNMSSDIDELYVPAAHWDRESFAASSLRMRTLLASLISDLKAGDTTSARLELGKLFHNAQDFYSHSNYVEMSSPPVYDLFNMPVIPSNTTCAPGAIPAHLLVTGYYPDDETPAGKCEHAQLNKDMPNDNAEQVDFYPAYEHALAESTKLIATVKSALASDSEIGSALAGKYFAYLTSNSAPRPVLASSLPYGVYTCVQGYVWRQASATDFVCVLPSVRSQAASDNAAAKSRYESTVTGSTTNLPYGIYTCINGYVWRSAFSGDYVCVVPSVRAQAAADNAAAQGRYEINAN